MGKSEKSADKGNNKKLIVASGGSTLTPFDEMDRLFEEFLGQRWPRAWMHPFRWEHPAWAEPGVAPGRIPRVDVIDSDTEILVRAELPGVKKENIDVSISEDSVTIRGGATQEEKAGSFTYYRSEIHHGEFSRTVGLPGSVDANKAKAKLENGILELILPKVEKAKRKSIKVE